MKSIDDRADLIDKGVGMRRMPKSSLTTPAREARQVYRRSSQAAGRDTSRGRPHETEIIEEARAAASKEAQKVMDAAKVSIEQARKEARQQFRDEVSSFALDIATKVVRGQMADRKAQTKLVDSLLDEMETNN